MSSLRTQRFPMRLNFRAFLAISMCIHSEKVKCMPNSYEFCVHPRNVKKMRNHTLPKFRHGTESFEDTDGFPVK